MTFSLILFLLTVFTGVLWVLDVFIWAPKRRAVAQDELTEFDRDNAESLRRGEQTVVAQEMRLFRPRQTVRNGWNTRPVSSR